MGADDKSAMPPEGDGDPKKPDQGSGEPDPGYDRLWNSPIGTGEPIPFDPTKFVPPLSKEEIEELLGEKDK
jgi:hypothetical protein